MRAQRHVSEIIRRMRRCPQPIVACVHGAAAGGGLALALAADVRLAAPSARMNVAMALVGLTGCDIGISYFLPRAVGRRWRRNSC
jgi:enoyl-CoA hydratase/carnithine racemase